MLIMRGPRSVLVPPVHAWAIRCVGGLLILRACWGSTGSENSLTVCSVGGIFLHCNPAPIRFTTTS